MRIVNSFEMLGAYIPEQIISQILEASFVLLPFESLLLREQAFQFVNSDVALHMATDNKNILRFIDSLNIQAGNAIRLHRFIDQSFYFLLTVIEQPHRAIRTSNRYEVFNSRNAIGNTLRNIYIAMEPFSYF